MKKLEQRREKPCELFPFPEEGRLVEENPPCLSWLKVPGATEYTAVIYRDGKRIWSGTTDRNYIIPDPLPAPGEYAWDLFCGNAARGEIRFMLSSRAVEICRTTGSALYDAVPDVRPRHLFSAADLTALRKRTNVCETLRRNIRLALMNGMPERPMFHRDPEALPYREYFGRFRDYCDRDLIACALGYAVLGDEDAGKHARQLMLTFCDWNPEGPCSLNGPWGDEVGLSLARCLPSALDLLWPLLTDKERDYAARTVHAYGDQCRTRLKRLDFTQNPGNSHAGRIPAYLGEAAAVLKGTGVQDRKEAVGWLDYALEIYGGIFPYYGTPDGGWAEGPFYASSYTKWYLPFFSLVERFTGCRFLDRPFYQRLPQFFLHFASPAFENHPFGDGYWCGSEDAEWPGFFAQNPLRVYAARTGPQLALKRAEEAEKTERYLLHLLDLFLPEGKAPRILLNGEAENTAVFPDAGFVSMHTALADPGRDLAVLARASKFGSDSHRHADQGSFALFCGGAALVSPSGYFGRQYGSEHHRKWCKTTRAHNAILVNGKGQETDSMASSGKIVFCRDDGDKKTALLDLSDAYPSLACWHRTLILEEERLTVTDEIEAVKDAVVITWPLHTLSAPEADGNAIQLTRSGIAMRAEPGEGGLVLRGILDRFPVDLNAGQPDAYHVSMPPQYHVFWETAAAKRHRITVSLTVHRVTEKEEPGQPDQLSKYGPFAERCRQEKDHTGN